MSLSELHAEHLAKLTGEALVDYLMNCLDYLTACPPDLDGWKKRFMVQVDTSIVTKQQSESIGQQRKKKRRMSPDAVVEEKQALCLSCKSPDVIDDMGAGWCVCTACGMVQQSQLLGTGHANMSYEQLKNGNRKTVHHYSRVVYFRSFLMGIQGKTTPIVTQVELESLRRICVGESSDLPVIIDEQRLVLAMVQLGLSTRLRRHRFSLLSMLNESYVSVHIPAPELFAFLRAFRAVECSWQHGMRRRLGERKVFFSYPYVFYQLCVHFGLLHLTGEHHLIRSRDALSKLHYAYGCIANKIGFRCDVSVYRC